VVDDIRQWTMLKAYGEVKQRAEDCVALRAIMPKIQYTRFFVTSPYCYTASNFPCVYAEIANLPLELSLTAISGGFWSNSFCRPDVLSVTQPKASKKWRQIKQLQKNCRSRTGIRCCIFAWQTLRVHSLGGTTLLHEVTSWPPSEIVTSSCKSDCVV